ncbi:hypothetical protein ACP4OV_016554 [Aristida adscensionis]
MKSLQRFEQGGGGGNGGHGRWLERQLSLGAPGLRAAARSCGAPTYPSWRSGASSRRASTAASTPAAAGTPAARWPSRWLGSPRTARGRSTRWWLRQNRQRSRTGRAGDDLNCVGDELDWT